jgi:hypothetical protein
MAELKPETKEKECVHYWIIDFPEGPVSNGVCKHCGMKKRFFNSLDNIELQNDERYKIACSN